MSINWCQDYKNWIKFIKNIFKQMCVKRMYHPKIWLICWKEKKFINVSSFLDIKKMFKPIMLVTYQLSPLNNLIHKIFFKILRNQSTDNSKCILEKILKRGWGLWMKGFLETFTLLILNLEIFDQMSMINEFADFLNLWWYGTPFNINVDKRKQ